MGIREDKALEWPRLGRLGRIKLLLSIVLVGLLHGSSFLDIFPWSEIRSAVQFLGFILITFLLFVHERKKQALWTALLFGTVNHLVGFSWLWRALYEFGQLGIVGSAVLLLVFSAGLALYFVLAVWLVFFVTERVDNIRVLGCLRFVFLWAASYTLMAYIQSIFLTGFTWNDIAYVYSDGFIYSLVPMIGGLGLDFCVVFLATSFLMFLINRLPYIETGFFLLLSIVVSFLFIYVPWTSLSGKDLHVRLIQTNVPQSLKFDEAFLDEQLSQLEFLIYDSSPLGHLDLIVTPENAVPLFASQVPIEFWERLLHFVQKKHVKILLGMPIFEKVQGEESYYIYNSVVQIDDQTSLDDLLYEPTRLPHYNKQHLVPFGEYTPNALKFLASFYPSIPLSGFTAGSDRQPFFKVKDQNIASAICYEDGFGDIFRSTVLPDEARGASNIWINLSNLAWFGGDSVLLQHQYISMLRAKEFGRPILRATNTGATVFINETGQVVQQLMFNERGNLDVIAQGVDGRTPFSYIGDRGIALFALAVYLFCWLPLSKKKYRSQSQCK